MARRFTRSPRGVGHGRRLTEWAATAPETTYTNLAAATAILDSFFTAEDPETVIRVVGTLNIQSDQVAGGEEPFGAIGLCVVSDQAFAIGVTAIPTPYTDASSDLWLMHRFWQAPIAVATAASIARVDTLVDLTSKAMRKINPDQTLVLVIENGAGAHGVEYRLDVRVLAKVA